MGRIVAFVSGKGGTGKTSMCAAIAACLAAQKKTVLCIDLDVGLRNLDIALGMAKEPLLPFTSLMDGTYDLDKITEHPAIPGLKMLTAPVAAAPEDVDEREFARFLQTCEAAFDFVLLDAPAGIGAGFRLAAKCCGEAVVVTGGDKAALRDGARAAQSLDGVSARVLVNRVSRPMFRKMKATIDDVMDEVSLPLLGLVPEDKTVTLAAAQGTPLILESCKGASLACLRISRRLLGMKEPVKIQ